MDWGNLTSAESQAVTQDALDRMRPPGDLSDCEKVAVGNVTLAYSGKMDGVLGQVVAWGCDAALHEPWDRAVLGSPLPFRRSLRQDIQRDVIDYATRNSCLDLLKSGITDLVRSAQFQKPFSAYASEENAVAIETRLALVARSLVDSLYDTYYQRGLTESEWESAWQAFRMGVALTLYGIWRTELAAHGLPEDQWMPDIADGEADPDDHLAGREPTSVGGCELYPYVASWLLSSERGLMRASHSTVFVSFLRVAYVARISKNSRQLTVPIPSHVDALKELGFRQVVLPGGRELQL